MNFTIFMKNLIKCKKYLKSELSLAPIIAFILGTGFSCLSEELEMKKVIPYKSIPFLKENSIPGQESELAYGLWKNKNVLMFKKRFHFYEGFTPLECTFPIWLSKELGVKYVFLFCASGGVNETLRKGDILLIDDQINLTGKNPLIEIPLEKRNPLFLNTYSLFDKDLNEEILKIAEKNNIKIKKGIYAGLIGPSYETPAEVKMLKIIGADIVGMSIVFESLVAHYLKLRTIAISVVANESFFHKELSHEIVVENIKRKIPVLKKLIDGVLNIIK